MRPLLESPLAGKVVALPESRQLDVLATLFERRQAQVIRIPLVTILDSPDQSMVAEWLESFIECTPDYFIILTGEGLRRLLGAADRNGMLNRFREALAQTCKVCRGPKPGRALSEIDLKPDLLGASPTTAGVIETLKQVSLADKKVAVQLYGTEPNLPLMDFLGSRGVKQVEKIAPYIYAPESDSARVVELLELLHRDKIHLIAFTSKPQVRRLFAVAREQGLLDILRVGLIKTHVAAIGPVVEKELEESKVTVSVAPTDKYFMKSLVKASETLFS
ncbi:MAG: uroporphyrinogen-III synthase [Gammaproteobacteria bacterium]|nr:uroporphyrinogen-III synthase [Gammaproteobacteria bacterium]